MPRIPTTTLDPNYSSPDARAVPWESAVNVLESAEIYWITTVQPNGAPHVVPLIAVWHDDALCFSTGAEEQKVKNLAANPRCVLSTGTNLYATGLDVMLHGRAERVRGRDALQRIADLQSAKYGPEWTSTVTDDGFRADGGHQTAVYVYRLTPEIAYGFRREGEFSQTRWQFERA